MSELRDVIRAVVAQQPKSSVGYTEGGRWLLSGPWSDGDESVLDVDGLTEALVAALIEENPVLES